jgi:hypothetical protein
MQSSFFDKAATFLIALLLILFVFPTSLSAQVDVMPIDSAAAEEDYSQYDNLDFAADGARRYCSPKIEGLSPAKLISLGYDYQMGYSLDADSLRSNLGSANFLLPQNAKVLRSHGMRIAANIPMISKTHLVWQLGANYWEQRYDFENFDSLKNPLLRTLQQNGLRTMGLNTTVFKPLNDKQFILFQGSADYSGDYAFNDLMPMKYLKYSAALIWGKRPTEKKQWGIGIARTYRVGELNYIPVVLYNYTDAANKWGSEILFPARAHVRRTFNSRNMLFFGYELEGQSYRLWNSSPSAGNNAFMLRDDELEIRRGEIRLRFVYEFSLKGFVWMSVQAGYRLNYRFDVDRLVSGKEIYRAFGFASDAPYVMVNELGNPFYINVSFNLVSP